MRIVLSKKVYRLLTLFKSNNLLDILFTSTIKNFKETNRRLIGILEKALSLTGEGLKQIIFIVL
jgi:hypothetical protein